MNANLTKLVNGKLVFCLPQNIINYLPHNNKQLTNEMVVRLVLTTPEPEDSLSNQDKIKYHVQKNTEFVEKYKNEWQDLLFTDISHIDNEVWLGFDKMSDDIIFELTKLDEVCCVYLYDKPKTNATLTSNLYVASDQASILKELSSKLFLTVAKPVKTITKEAAEEIEVNNANYDPLTKTLTLNLTKYTTEAAVEQLFGYLYTKQENYEDIIRKLAVEVLTNLSYHRHEQVARINFVIDDTNWPQNTFNRYFQIIPLELGNLSTKELQDKYLNSSVFFKQDTSEEDMIKMINLTLERYKDLFYAASVQPLDIIELLSKLDPEQITLDKIEQNPNDKGSLYVKLTVFDTQQKMNLLYGYLASEPYNKDQWISRLKELILNGLEQTKLGKISDYHFVTFDSDNQVEKFSVTQAAIGGIDLSLDYYGLDSDEVEVKELFLDLSKNFTGDEDFDVAINRNIQWNRHTYLNYFFKDSIVFYFGSRVKRAINGYALYQTYWEIFNNLKNSLNPIYRLENNELTIKLGGFKNLEDFKVLLYLINNDDNNLQTGQAWSAKLVDIIQTGLKAVNAKLRNLKSLYVSIGEDINDKLMLLDLVELALNHKTEDFESPKPTALKQVLYENFNRMNPDLILAAINAGLVASALEDKEYALQYMAVGLGSFFNSEKAGKINFNGKDTKIGVLEANNGIILPFHLEHFNSGKLVTNTQDGKFSSHADLVGRIIGSVSEGVDTTSTIYSAGFKYSYENSITPWNALKAVEWMVEQDVKLLNCSWGLSKRKETDPDFVTYSELAYKLDYVTRKYGIAIFKSAGNDHEKYKPYFRAVGLAFNTITVGSTTINGHSLSVFSDFEKLQLYKMTKEAPKPLLVAPGEAYKYSDTYMDGTSFSAPLVTGTASLLMKEYPTNLERKPAAMMAVLAASSDDRYPGRKNNNGLKYETGAGLLNYNTARSAARNVVNFEVENNLEVNKEIYVSSAFDVQKGQTICMGTAVLYNGGYITSIDLPELKPTKGGISSVPIIGYLYLTYAYIYNNYKTSSFNELFADSRASMLKMEQSIDVNNLDTYLMPINVTAVLQKYFPTTRKWVDVDWDEDVDSHYSNIKRFEHYNKETACTFRYSIRVCRQGNHITGDHTKNQLAFTYVLKN